MGIDGSLLLFGFGKFRIANANWVIVVWAFNEELLSSGVVRAKVDENGTSLRLGRCGRESLYLLLFKNDITVDNTADDQVYFFS